MNPIQRAAVEAARAPGATVLEREQAERRFIEADPDFIAAQGRSYAAMGGRSRLPAGSTRARVTTANARWANAAEHRDRVQERVRREFAAAVADAPRPAKPKAKPVRSFSAMLQAKIDKMNERGR